MRFTATDDTGQVTHDLYLYDVVVMLTNATMCRKITASTLVGSEIEIRISDDNSNFTLQIDHTLTAELCAGDLTISVMLIHKQSGARIIAERRLIAVVESKIGRIEL